MGSYHLPCQIYHPASQNIVHHQEDDQIYWYVDKDLEATHHVDIDTGCHTYADLIDASLPILPCLTKKGSPSFQELFAPML